MLKKKSILFIAHNYNSFQKDQIDSVADHFENVYILVRVNPLFRLLSRFFPGKYKVRYSKAYTIDLHNKPENIKIFETPVYYLPHEYFYKSLGKLHFISALKVINKNNIKFDLIHTHFLWSSGYVGMKLKEIFKKPLVVTGHGYDVYKLPNKTHPWKENIVKVLKSADKITTPSKSNKEILKSYDSSLDVIVIPNGYKETLFYPIDKNKCREKLGLDLNKTFLLSVGNLELIKGHEYLIQAVSMLREKDLSCIIIGEGSRMYHLVNLAEKLDIKDKIMFIGRKQHGELVEWMSAADIFVMPSIRESFGVVQIEAMACGIPVVATRNGGSEEIITNSDHGLLCEKENATILAQTIERALKIEWGSNEIIDYAENFKWTKINEQFINIYENYNN